MDRQWSGSADGGGAPAPGTTDTADSDDGGGAGGGGSPFTPPSVSLPKGGGAVRGIGETFATNPATGTGTLTIPLPASPGRSGFGPSLNLAYDSGAGHGPFGLGWSVGLPMVTRRTDQGLPTYDDASDVFLLAGNGANGEELVPVSRTPERTVDGVRYAIVTYRPEIEGLYARIERWTALDGGLTHWRTISRDNITTLFGTDRESRVADPADPDRRVFSWLARASYDASGNAMLYHYVAEDAAGVARSAAHESGRERSPGTRTANRYLKSVRYGNATSRLVEPDLFADRQWHFELVFDYGEHHPTAPRAGDTGDWLCRADPKSQYRAGFEVRTYRLCQRVLMFHHFDLEPGVGQDCLVRSMTLGYRGDPRHGEPGGAMLASVTLTGHRSEAGRPVDDPYVAQSFPAIELTYSVAEPGTEVAELDAETLTHLPDGFASAALRLVDLDADGVPGALIERAGGWYYLPNAGGGVLGPVREVAPLPAVSLSEGELLDLDGDGTLDLVSFGGAAPGSFERTESGWSPHRAFTALPVLDWDDPDLRFTDLTGDGRPDVLVTQGDALVWYPSRGEYGFGPGVRVPLPPDDDAGPRLLFSDASRSVFVGDLSGDGQPDICRVRNAEICYWPNLGYGRFGAKVVMDDAPLFDHPDRFDPARLQFGDVDGNGLTDILYLGDDGVDLYVNQMGNSWSARRRVPAFPTVDNLSAVSLVDLLGRGTACLVWSSALPGDAGRQVRYVDLTGVKPHLLTRVRNNLGAETVIRYASSTELLFADRRAGRPWITRLPFPVHVVEAVETYDRSSRNLFISRYAYHDGYFDGRRREFRGFHMVEQFDTVRMAALAGSTEFPDVPAAQNLDAAGQVPPVVTRSWFHTGASLDRDRISRLAAEQYFPPDDLELPEAAGWLLPDTPLPPGLGPEDEADACRALKGRLLRREVYAQDGDDWLRRPYSVEERNYTIDVLAAGAPGRRGVFAVSPAEALTVTCERDPTQPRVAHEMVLAVDRDSGTVTHSVSVAYGRAGADGTLPERTRAVQGTTLLTETRVEVTGGVRERDDDPPGMEDAHRVPVPYLVRVDEVAGATVAAARPRLSRPDVERLLTDGVRTEVSRTRTRFFADDLSGPLAWGVQGRRGLTHETYRLGGGPAALAVFDGRLTASMLPDAGYSRLDPATDEWWAPSGTVRYAPAGTTGVLGYARQHFFVPRRYVDPFAARAVAVSGLAAEYATSVELDEYDLLVVRTVDPVGNTVTAGEVDAAGTLAGRPLLDYRLLAPALVTDANGNRTAVRWTALGLVAATAVMGKAGADTGDRLGVLDPDPNPATVGAFWADPFGDDPATPAGVTARGLLGQATTRFVYDLHAFKDNGRPPGVATVARERHVAAGGTSALQLTFGYSDGAGREVQRRLPAAPTPAGARQWICSGWTIVNNKGLPVRQYEPAFRSSHQYEFAVLEGVSSILCYDPVGRLVATLHPNHTYEKVRRTAWSEQTWDANDTAALPDLGGSPTGNPGDDPDVRAFAELLPDDEYLPTWFRRRTTPDLLLQFGARAGPESDAATRTARHAGTPTTAALDPLGRQVLVAVANRGPDTSDPASASLPWMQLNWIEGVHRTHSVFDTADRLLRIDDCVDTSPTRLDARRDRVVVRYEYDLLGNGLAAHSMEAGSQWQLTDIGGRAVRAWERLDNGTDRRLTTAYDRLRRPTDLVLTDNGVTTTVGRTRYGETAPGASTKNLRGQVWIIHDDAGTLTQEYDVQGSPVLTRRELTQDYRQLPDWSAAPEPTVGPPLEASARFDALNRPEQRIHPDATVVRFAYTQAGLLDRVMGRIPGEATDTDFVTGIRYNARGQRTRVTHGNDTATEYTYEPDTFRLQSLTTPGWQRLEYTYDPVGNLTQVVDDAQQTVFHLNTLVPPSSQYLYDATYQLVEAAGREHLGLTSAGTRAPSSWTDAPRVHVADRQALSRYRERYRYDAAGNLTSLDHRGTAQDGWHRTLRYAEPSQLEPAPTPEKPDPLFSNRLTSERVGNGPETVFTHDAQGSMSLPWLTAFAWDHRHRLAESSRQFVNGAAVRRTTYYRYDTQGRRVRKVTDDFGGPLSSERVYLGDFELHRTFDGNGAVAAERSTVHIVDGERRVAIIERRVDPSGETVVRYQLSNHLGSAVVELDRAGGLITYEEYHPYGSTAISFVEGGVLPKRYRFSGKERDEETGLTYHGARYYAPWLMRWVNADPLGAAAGTNLYRYCRGRPTVEIDPTGQDSEPPNLDPARLSARLLDPSEQLQLRSTPQSQAPPERTFMSRGGRLVIGGAVMLGFGLLTIATGGTALLAVGVLGVSAGGAGMAVGLSQLGLSYSGQTTAQQDADVIRAGELMMSSSRDPLGAVTAGVAIVATGGDLETTQHVLNVKELGQAAYGGASGVMGFMSKGAGGAPSGMTGLLAKLGHSESKMQLEYFKLAGEETPWLYKFVGYENLKYPTVRGYVTPENMTGDTYDTVLTRLDLRAPKLIHDYAEGGVLVRFKTTYGNLELPPIKELGAAEGYRTAATAMRGFTAGPHPVPELKLVQPIVIPAQPTTGFVAPTKN